MRCPSCNRFASYDEPQVEVQDESVDPEGHVTATVEVVMPCNNCGEQLKSASLELDTDIDHQCDRFSVAESHGIQLEPGGDPTEGDIGSQIDELINARSLSVEITAEPYAEYGANRYSKTYYGAELYIHVECDTCGGAEDSSETLKERASAFEELV